MYLLNFFSKFFGFPEYIPESTVAWPSRKRIIGSFKEEAWEQFQIQFNCFSLLSNFKLLENNPLIIFLIIRRNNGWIFNFILWNWIPNANLRQSDPWHTKADYPQRKKIKDHRNPRNMMYYESKISGFQHKNWRPGEYPSSK